MGNQTATVNSDIRNAKMADISRVQTIILVLCSFILLTTEVQTFSKSKNSKQGWCLLLDIIFNWTT